MSTDAKQVLDTNAMNRRLIDSLKKSAQEVDRIAQQCIKDRHDGIESGDSMFFTELCADLSLAHDLINSLPITRDGFVVAGQRRVFYTTFNEVLWLDVDHFIPPAEHDGYREGWVLCGSTQHQTREQIPAVHCHATRESAEQHRKQRGATQ